MPSIYGKQKSHRPLYTFEKDRNVPGFGMTEISGNQAAMQAKDRVDRAERRSGSKFRGPMKNGRK